MEGDSSCAPSAKARRRRPWRVRSVDKSGSQMIDTAKHNPEFTASMSSKLWFHLLDLVCERRASLVRTRSCPKNPQYSAPAFSSASSIVTIRVTLGVSAGVAADAGPAWSGQALHAHAKLPGLRLLEAGVTAKTRSRNVDLLHPAQVVPTTTAWYLT